MMLPRTHVTSGRRTAVARSAQTGAYSPFWPLVVDGGMPMAW